MDFWKPTVIAIPFFLLTFSLEWWAVKAGRAKGRYETKDALTSLAMGLGSVMADTLFAFVGTWLLMLFWPYRLFDVPVTWWSFIIVFVAYDLIYYWKHRFAHIVRWWWMEHVTHHSSEHYNLTTALRQPWFGPLTGLVIISAPLVLLGFHPAFIALSAGVNLVYQYWIHTEAIGRMYPWFEAVMNTPSHHRVHHATNPRYLDANFAGVFIVWDRMFGSFVPELDHDKPVYGIVTPLKSYNPFVVAYHGLGGLLRDCASDGFRPWRWIGRAINNPGWSPDGNHARSRELKMAYLAAHPDQAGTPGLPVKYAGQTKTPPQQVVAAE
ncbi:MAG: C-5 sterol desaturase [Rhodobacterales bacterium 12-64-8]|nr:MAG: C-5 sterol desaturase [Rhodobacterales bacterium 12-64-8]OYX50991.1 MAG: C-5 sterol desaturase [Alphaproteobacteria bacterium 32-64-14]